MIEPEKKLIISGKFQKRDENASQIIIDSVKPVEICNLVTVTVNTQMPFEKVMALKSEITQYKGDDPLFFKIKDNDNFVKIAAPSMFWVNGSNDFAQGLERAFKDEVKVEIASASES